MTEASPRATVVVANTDETVCEVLGRLIEAGGHEAVRVTDPDQVSGAVLSAPADAVLLDLGAGNTDQLRALRSGGSERGSEVRAVVVCTGPATARQAWHGGADVVLTRPMAASAVAEAVAEALARSAPERDEVRQREADALTP